jgi:phosphoglycolate phosphatase
VVITAKHPVPARASLDGAGLAADDLYADAYGPEKAAVLAAIGAGVYVGDTPADMAAARSAGAVAAGVTTGSFTGSDLLRAGADVVLASLAEFPEWYNSIT